VAEDSTYANFNVIYDNGMNFTKKNQHFNVRVYFIATEIAHCAHELDDREI